MKLFKKLKKNGSCCHTDVKEIPQGLKKIVLVGSPNVGKSVMFNNLTGSYVTVSNYPGTTVEVSRGKGRIGMEEFEIIDTPGMYSLLPITEEEKVARDILINENPFVVLHIVDAKNLERMLPLTFQLIEAELPVILVLNMADELRESGKEIDTDKLEKLLKIPVVLTVSTSGEGVGRLKKEIRNYVKRRGIKIKYETQKEFSVERAIKNIESLLKKDYGISKRSVSLLILQEDGSMLNLVGENESFNEIKEIVDETKKHYVEPLDYVIAIQRQKNASLIAKKVIREVSKRKSGFKEQLNKVLINPFSGFPVFLLVIYGLYEFVGVFGAQTAVDFLEEVVFGRYINPFITKIVSSIIPLRILQDLFVHEYGIITLGVRYAVAIILPIVATFFIAFSIIEDTGYLPRLAMLIDKLFKKIGLNGRAVIPIVLGFGCDTMATMVTRTLETKRERIIASFLLALAIPCSAQLGVILALLSGNAKALWIWIAVMTFIFIFIGYLSSRIIPGEKTMFYMEVSPLRWPKFSNVFTKTYTRVEWYFKEIFPLFILASIFIWIGRITGIFEIMVKLISYPVKWIGLPEEAATAFLFGFFRRDYGAAGLYDLKKAGILSGIPLVVAVVTLSLFVPCIAQFSVTIKERGLKTALLMVAFIFPFAFLVGGLVNIILVSLGVSL